MDSDPIGEVFFALCKGFDTPRSLGAWLLFKYGEHAQLASMKTNPNDYETPDAFFSAYTVTSYLSKYKGLATGIDTREVALRSFKDCEVVCANSNRRLIEFRNGTFPFHLGGIFHAAQRKISRLLGPFSMFALDGDERWGPHATLDVARRKAQVDLKMTLLPFSVSLRARPFFRRVIERDLHWSAAILGVFPDGPFSLLPCVFDIREEARIETVPKSAKTDRVIAVEPRGNGFLQKAVGSYIRKRLRRVGIDLNDQTVNADAARRGVDEGLATLDLRAASDTICKEIVFDLLPLEWAEYLNDIRTHYAILEKERIKLNKFSSMGNGFTFELETLIFWALTSASVDESCPGGEVLVYGDDIVCPNASVALVKEVLEFAGFSLNSDKSFGPESVFRESCGSHFFSHDVVTPVYQKEVLLSYREVIRAGNRLLRAAYRSCNGWCADSRFRGAWEVLRRLEPDTHRLTIPIGDSGDDAWLVGLDLFHFIGHSRNRGSLVEVLKPVTRDLPGHASALLAYHLRTNSPSASDEGRADDISVPTDFAVVSSRWVHSTGSPSNTW